jgi:hypothetical protein
VAKRRILALSIPAGLFLAIETLLVWLKHDPDLVTVVRALSVSTLALFIAPWSLRWTVRLLGFAVALATLGIQVDTGRSVDYDASVVLISGALLWAAWAGRDRQDALRADCHLCNSDCRHRELLRAINEVDHRSIGIGLSERHRVQTLHAGVIGLVAGAVLTGIGGHRWRRKRRRL